MNAFRFRYFLFLAALLMSVSTTSGFAKEIERKPMHFELPVWFKQSFLDVPGDVQEAHSRGKKLMVFFHLEDCPYCAHLLQENFVKGANRDSIERQFDVIAINVRGDLPVTWIDGTVYPEKQLARKLGVFATPAIFVMGPKPEVSKKIMGYKKPDELMRLLDLQ